MHLFSSHAFVCAMMVLVTVFTALTINTERSILSRISERGAYINVSGLQRMYSQRISMLKAVEDTRSCLSYGDEFDYINETFVEAHEELSTIPMSRTTRDAYFTVDDTLKDFQAQLLFPSTECSLVEAATTFLGYMNELVGLIETDLSDEVSDLSLTLTAFQCALFCIVVLAGVCSTWRSEREKKGYVASTDRMIQYLFHEIRNPLNHVVNGLDHVLQTGPANMPTDDITGELGRCSAAGVIITALLDDVLAMAAIDSKATIPVYATRIPAIVNNVSDIVSLSSSQSHCNVKVETHVELSCESYMTNAVKLSQVLMNFATNAVKYAGPEKTVTIGVTTLGQKSSHKKSKDVLQFFVKDNGVGMTKETQKQLFSKFKTFHRDSGTGLGLFIANSIVRDMGGKIGVVSPDPATGCGTMFEFKLTMDRCSETDCVGGDLPSATSIQPNLTILVADDEQINCKILQRKLTSKAVSHLKWTILQSMTLPGVLDTCKTSHVDVILLDEHFGNGQLGSVYISTLRNNGIRCPVITASANCSPSDSAMYQSRGAFSTIGKPMPASEILVATIAQAYESAKIP
ncbi:EsV-1-14 [Ectocarpus siliculosus virus 1]|uniref:histidine kinase n=1 Tax=Ectocarpus siliculosus virus 1 (isolate New Zealand/Kaikoura/1988) TaxID=654926 RepID=Q8QKW6_ESV1K|nr:EsV-1-14 [Ectocarpus siliculosus virus 1]AAK14440.1 EsV-1-14 [Ectocarpus siliculosus virus 1]